MNRYQYVETKGWKRIPIDTISSCEVIGSAKDIPHWGWFVFWLLVFWPVIAVLIIMGITRTKHTVKVNYKSGSPELVQLNKEELTKLTAMVRCTNE